MKTTVRINKVYNGSFPVKATASINFDGCFAVTGLKVVEGKNGLFVNMPSQQVKDGTYKDVAFPVTKEYREELQNAVLMAYEQKLEETLENKQEQKKNGNGGQEQTDEQTAGAEFEEQADPAEEFEETETQGMSMGM